MEKSAKLKKITPQTSAMQDENTELSVFKIYDDEEAKMVKVSPELQKRAIQINHVIVNNAETLAYGIKIMFDEKLYLALGYSGKQEYVANELAFGIRQAQHYYNIATNYEKEIGKKLIEPGTDNEEEIKRLNQRKLITLFGLKNNSVKMLAEEGSIKDKDGKEHTIEEIKDMLTKEVERKFKKEKTIIRMTSKKIQNEKHRLEEDNAKLKAERDFFKDQAETRWMTESKFGPPASMFEHKRKRLHKAKDLFDEAMMIFNNVDVLPDDPAELIIDTAGLSRHIESSLFRTRGLYHDVIERALDIIGDDPEHPLDNPFWDDPKTKERIKKIRESNKDQNKE